MAANSQFAVATHIVTVLAAFRSEGRPVKSALLASSVNTNPVVVRRLIAQLVRAGLVKSSSGKAGGFSLGRAPEKISLGEIYRAVGETAVFALNRNCPNPRCPVSASIGEALEPVFARVQKGVRSELDAIRLSSILRAVT